MPSQIWADKKRLWLAVQFVLALKICRKFLKHVSVLGFFFFFFLLVAFIEALSYGPES